MGNLLTSNESGILFIETGKSKVTLVNNVIFLNSPPEHTVTKNSTNINNKIEYFTPEAMKVLLSSIYFAKANNLSIKLYKYGDGDGTDGDIYHRFLGVMVTYP